jgi:hypothetical protein
VGQDRGISLAERATRMNPPVSAMRLKISMILSIFLIYPTNTIVTYWLLPSNSADLSVTFGLKDFLPNTCISGKLKRYAVGEAI